MSTLMPAIFFGHGNPMNALSDNRYTQAWANIGQTIARPKAILAISAHWYGDGIAVTSNPMPPTIHDFGGFPQALFEVDYPAPGSPALANRVQALLSPLPVTLDDGWGLDHGTWSVLCQVFPQADIPVVQLRIDATQANTDHFKLGRTLGKLREEGILVMGSGNLVHNLRAYGWGKEVPPYDWAIRFEQQAKDLIVAGDMQPLIDYPALGDDAMLAIPTPEHYLPLLYVLGTRRAHEAISFPIEGMEGGSISMLAVQVG